MDKNPGAAITALLAVLTLSACSPMHSGSSATGEPDVASNSDDSISFRTVEEAVAYSDLIIAGKIAGDAMNVPWSEVTKANYDGKVNLVPVEVTKVRYDGVGVKEGDTVFITTSGVSTWDSSKFNGTNSFFLWSEPYPMGKPGEHNGRKVFSVMPGTAVSPGAGSVMKLNSSWEKSEITNTELDAIIASKGGMNKRLVEKQSPVPSASN